MHIRSIAKGRYRGIFAAAAFFLGLSGLPFLYSAEVSAAPSPAVAFYYGSHPPWNELRVFDVVVVQPENVPDPSPHEDPDHRLFAYASVGEVERSRSYFQDIPAAWLRGRNENWDSALIDESEPQWPVFFVEHVIAPLWQQGYRGFFLDNLDSYQRFAASADARQAQQAGLIAVVRAIKRRFPDAALIFNRGFELLPEIHDSVYMLAAESLFRGWDPAQRRFIEVGQQDREWLLPRLEDAHRRYGLPVIVIDYVPFRERPLARETARHIRALGYIPWVATPDLDALGVGEVEVIPRKVLVLYDPREASDVVYLDAQRFLGAPFAYLGLVPEYRSIEDPLPGGHLADRYAGLIMWFGSDEVASSKRLVPWLLENIDEGLHLAVIGRFGVPIESPMWEKLGLGVSERNKAERLAVAATDPMMNFELPVGPRESDIFPVRLKGLGRPLITLQSAGDPAVTYHPAALMPWGGYVLAPYVEDSLAGSGKERWFVNPLDFLSAALALPRDAPVPDITTEGGRRMLMVHIDGDGFMNVAERSDHAVAGEALYSDVLMRYRIPTTVSVIEGEIGPDGLYPQQSPRLEAAARKIFALPWVEAASHSYSHPFNWGFAEDPSDNAESYHLPIPNYVYSVDREIAGSINYINKRLLPTGKTVAIFLWTGNCVATADALQEVHRLGVLNMNGGETTITRSANSWTQMAGPGLPRGDGFQVFAPNQNENVYTHLWNGPFYGFERDIETFELTGHPYRFKPIDIYYHFYSATKTASLAALRKVYDWALSQQVTPVFASDYIRKVLDFNHFAVARNLDGSYRLRGDGSIRTVRIAAGSTGIDWTKSSNVAGIADADGARYITLSQGHAELATTADLTPVPHLVSVNGRVEKIEHKGNQLELQLRGYQPIEFEMADGQRCQAFSSDGSLAPFRTIGTQSSYRVEAHESVTLKFRCPTS